MSKKEPVLCYTSGLYDKLSGIGDTWIIEKDIPPGKTLSGEEWYYPVIVDSEDCLICTYLGKYHKEWYFHEEKEKLENTSGKRTKVTEEYLFEKTVIGL
ncbi:MULTISPECIES: hypothetical protein [Serratia]|uniref:hypothetical protein n=1 Tax=Serratia TaxID=613 RepID=UPI0011120FEC|nr:MULTISPECIES: hypothetical protein [Serratia]MDK4857064.1 hypothetical protein [Serratia nevei]HAU4336338.1 hypothetical protein [Serratia marcescens]HAU4345102.1 hypothetical protein [Serratia marcescens]HAU4393801.1 hypothetical protein [Serratia marcescens]HBB6704320.1 hypothetical protein [Serratia marcescens]